MFRVNKGTSIEVPFFYYVGRSATKMLYGCRENSGRTLARWLRVCAVLSVLLLLMPEASAGDSPASIQAAAWLRSAPAVDQQCAACHAGQVASFNRSAHAWTSSAPSDDSIKGSFAAGENVLTTRNPALRFELLKTPTGFFQKAILRTSPDEERSRMERIDVVVGSGRKGQTYLFWDDDKLFELPVSLWVANHQWVNSPGYVDGTARFERVASPRCLECHATSFVSRAPPINRYERASLILGISCVKCHGPGAEHIDRERRALGGTPPVDSGIINPAKLARGRQMDVCALCHSGAGRALKPPLSFTPGKALDQHIAFPPVAAKAHVDVHASQVQLLERSRCFRESATMTCSTCHDVHRTRRTPSDFAADCRTCHQPQACGKFAKLGAEILNRCVECHMPLETTARIVMRAAGVEQMQPQVRNHTIAIYPAAN